MDFPSSVRANHIPIRVDGPSDWQEFASALPPETSRHCRDGCLQSSEHRHAHERAGGPRCQASTGRQTRRTRTRWARAQSDGPKGLFVCASAGRDWRIRLGRLSRALCPIAEVAADCACGGMVLCAQSSCEICRFAGLLLIGRQDLNLRPRGHQPGPNTFA
jgi:hypothetical protein